MASSSRSESVASAEVQTAQLAFGESSKAQAFMLACGGSSVMQDVGTPLISAPQNNF